MELLGFIKGKFILHRVKLLRKEEKLINQINYKRKG